MSKELIIKQDNIVDKVIKFFRKIFFERNIKTTELNIESKKWNENKFLNSIKIKKSSEEKRILDLQKKYENKLVNIEDISDEDFEKIIELYKKQTTDINNDTNNINKSTEFYKNKIMILKKELNTVKQ